MAVVGLVGGPARARKRPSPPNTACATCGRVTPTREYHPYLICKLLRMGMPEAEVMANVRAAVEYGMKAERAGVNLDDAMADHTKVR